jgi:hypothetical protein
VKTKPVGILIVAATLLFAACSLTHKTEGPDDAAIKDSIQAKLFQDATLKRRDIHVDSQKGVVTLTGAVASHREKLAVEGLARGATGVTQVVDQLTVSDALAAQTSAPAEPAASSPAPERPRESRHARRVMASSEAESSEAVETSAPEPTPQPAAPAPTTADTQIAQAQPAPTPQPPPPPPPIQVTVPAGTVITVRMIDGVDSATNRAGEEFAATLEAPIVVGNKVVIQRGADARARLVQVTSAGHIEGRSEVKLELVSISANGTTYTVQTGYYDQQGASRGKRTAATIGGASGLGALIGAIAGGGKGAAVGAGIGAAGGGVATAATKGQQVKIPSETKLVFTLKSPFTVTLNRSETAAVTPRAVSGNHPDFSGTWVLDKDRTPNVPSSLESYTLVARLSGQRITLQTRLQGNFRSGQRGISGGEEPGEGRGGYPGGGGGGLGFPAGGLGRMGGGMGGMSRGRRGGMGGARNGPRNGMMALQMTVPDGTYSLNGEETTVELPGRMSGKALVSANWVEGGKAVELSVDRRVEMRGNEVDIRSDEEWRLSADGQTLVADRSVNTPRGSESVKLTFRKTTETTQDQQ